MTAAHLTLAANAALVMLALAMALCLLRMVLGPHLGDRIVAADTTAVILISLITVLGIRARTGLYSDVAAVVAILGFVGTVAAARFLRGRPPFA